MTVIISCESRVILASIDAIYVKDIFIHKTTVNKNRPDIFEYKICIPENKAQPFHLSICVYTNLYIVTAQYSPLCITLRGFLLIPRKNIIGRNHHKPLPITLTNKVSYRAINELFVPFIGHVKSETQNAITEKVYRITDKTALLLRNAAPKN